MFPPFWWGNSYGDVLWARLGPQRGAGQLLVASCENLGAVCDSERLLGPTCASLLLTFSVV